MEDYLKAGEGLGIEKSVHLEADVDENFMLDETRHILGARWNLISYSIPKLDSPQHGIPCQFCLTEVASRGDEGLTGGASVR